MIDGGLPLPQMPRYHLHNCWTSRVVLKRGEQRKTLIVDPYENIELIYVIMPNAPVPNFQCNTCFTFLYLHLL